MRQYCNQKSILSIMLLKFLFHAVAFVSTKKIQLCKLKAHWRRLRFNDLACRSCLVSATDGWMDRDMWTQLHSKTNHCFLLSGSGTQPFWFSSLLYYNIIYTFLIISTMSILFNIIYLFFFIYVFFIFIF
jgi:hypothetical protein